MLTFTIEPEAGPKLAAYMEQVRVRITASIRSGMDTAMHDLAQFIVSSKLSGSPIQRRTGDLAEAVLASVRVKATEEQVHGSVAAKPKGQPNLGLWQEFGTHHPAVEGKLRVFSVPGGGIVFTNHLAEFTIAPKPFLNVSLREQQTQIIATIRARLAEAQL